jgi:excisionase family DNA binding protein
VAGVEQLLYSVREAAEIVGVGKSKMWELVGRGEIESVKVDALRKIPADALTSYVKRLRAEQAVDAVPA